MKEEQPKFKEKCHPKSRDLIIFDSHNEQELETLT